MKETEMEMDTDHLRIYEVEAPEAFKCYIEFEGRWRASRLATQMIHAEIAVFVEPWPDNMYRIYFKKDVAHIVEKILKGNY
jgi:hypothetical protein